MQGRYREVQAKTITRVPGFTDPWFLGRYGMNLYRGCEHACIYCDGRAERYYVEGDFGQDIVVKANAVPVLAAQLARIREPGFVFIGGGVSDAYQPADRQYQLARGALEVVAERQLPVHVLTKSALIERDLDLLEQINDQQQAILSFSIQTIDDEVRARFEPGAAPLPSRWRLLEAAKRRGIATGVMAMPVLPGISDTPEAIAELVSRAADAGVDFVLFGGLTLRPGVQMDTYLQQIEADHGELLDGYDKLYRARRASGVGDRRYYARVEQRFIQALTDAKLPSRIPRRLFSGRIPCYTELAVLLEHREHELRRSGKAGRSLGRSGMAIQRWARGRFNARRSRSFTWQDVERELLSLATSGELTSIEGVNGAAAAETSSLIGGLRDRSDGCPAK